jgi:hypothetical protein
MSLAISTKTPAPTQQAATLLATAQTIGKPSGVPEALLNKPDLLRQFGRLSEDQKKSLRNTLLLYPGARAEDLVAVTRTQSWNNAASHPSEANRRLGGMFRVVAMLSSTATGRLQYLDKSDFGIGVVRGGERHASPINREVASNTLHLILNGTIDLKVGSQSDLAKACSGPNARACAKNVHPSTGKSAVHVTFTDVERPGNVARDPIDFVPTIAHEASHAVDWKRFGTQSKTLLNDGLGYFVLATEYKANYVGALTSSYGFATQVKYGLDLLRNSKESYLSMHALLARNPAVRQLLDKAMQAANAGNPMPVNTFISALGQLRSQEKVFGWGGPDAVEQKFFRFQHNDRNLWTR